jgi:hypothetical protein
MSIHVIALVAMTLLSLGQVLLKLLTRKFGHTDLDLVVMRAHAMTLTSCGFAGRSDLRSIFSVRLPLWHRPSFSFRSRRISRWESA